MATDAFWISQPNLQGPRGPSTFSLIGQWHLVKSIGVFLVSPRGNAMGRETMDKNHDGDAFFVKKKDRHFYQLSIIIFYGGIFLCFLLLQ